jgi:sirohydrochlorin ferrochelatase
MDAIVLFSHGSVLCGSGEALLMHASGLRERRLAPIVEIGYLNYSDPPFSEAVDRCVAAGATRILVTPYFLVPGYFVKVDLPKAVESARQAHPSMIFTIAEPIGFDERLADALIASANTATVPDRWREDLKNAPRYCRANPQCSLYGTPACPKQPVPVPTNPVPA